MAVGIAGLGAAFQTRRSKTGITDALAKAPAGSRAATPTRFAHQLASGDAQAAIGSVAPAKSRGSWGAAFQGRVSYPASRRSS